ncbi:hypothetical protein E4T38_06359 [Aureobasidium subglaciale]|nr:hypothetical protein E4T38_06359 [Aureobasidium subglaciale]KAI5219486.1 hypothetical protein E4T40_06389 [Aureobasidium subglaciale]KAI5223217.1 hypothetical protein E4T41_06229 [Aureobasidium subglaciale]KAI5259762.1 hypothetical protein E4T46_06664 [Aureobasidium subglaciale]
MEAVEKMRSSNSSTLSDVVIKFSGQQVHAHKAILAHKFVYFLQAFTSMFKVASSDEVDLGDDDDVQAVYAMMCHIYDMPYADTFTNKSDIYIEGSLTFLLNVFIVADKYFVPCLREKVAPEFTTHLEIVWGSDEITVCVEKLCGPEAVQLANSSLQVAVAKLFNDEPSKIMYHSSVRNMIEQDKSFAGRVLTGLLARTVGVSTYPGVCHKPEGSLRGGRDCTNIRKGDPRHLAAFTSHCVHCYLPAGQTYHKSGGQPAETTLLPDVKVILL